MNPIQNDVHKTMCDYLNYMRQKVWESPKVFLHKQRLIKSPAEIALMQKSCDVASDSIIKTIKFSYPGKTVIIFIFFIYKFCCRY